MWYFSHRDMCNASTVWLSEIENQIKLTLSLHWTRADFLSLSLDEMDEIADQEPVDRLRTHNTKKVIHSSCDTVWIDRSPIPFMHSIEQKTTCDQHHQWDDEKMVLLNVICTHFFCCGMSTFEFRAMQNIQWNSKLMGKPSCVCGIYTLPIRTQWNIEKNAR